MGLKDKIDFKKYPILFVDDEILALETYKIQFRKEFNIFTAKNVAEAIMLLEKHEISVVITDQRMPEVGGIKLLEMIKEKKPHIMRILITGYSDLDLVIDAINKGDVYRYISKPYNEHEVITYIRQGIEKYFITKERDNLYSEKIETLKKILRANRLTAVGTLAAGMAHEINNPLSAISTFLQLVPQKYEEIERDSNFWDTYYQIVLTELERIRNLILRILQYSKFIPKDELEMEKTDFNELVESMMIFIDNEARGKGIILERVFQKDLIECYIDSEGMKQVIINLLLNAIQSMPEGGKITVETGLKNDKEGKFLFFSIHDRGVGISEENIPRLFTPFFTTKNLEGSGLGLMTCHQIVDAHRGTIEVKSLFRQGSTFTVKIPADPRIYERRRLERRSLI